MTFFFQLKLRIVHKLISTMIFPGIGALQTPKLKHVRIFLNANLKMPLLLSLPSAHWI